MSTANTTDTNGTSATATPPVEPAYRTAVIKTLNEAFAKTKSGIYLRLPQPNPRGHLRLFENFKWTNAQRDRCIADGTLPYDINTIPQNLTPTNLDIWIFDGRGSTGTSLPETEANPLPDLERFLALVIFSAAAAAAPAEASKAKFIPQLKDKIWMDHDCIKSEACTQCFTLLQEAMLKVPFGDLEKRVYGPQA